MGRVGKVAFMFVGDCILSKSFTGLEGSSFGGVGDPHLMSRLNWNLM